MFENCEASPQGNEMGGVQLGPSLTSEDRQGLEEQVKEYKDVFVEDITKLTEEERRNSAPAFEIRLKEGAEIPWGRPLQRTSEEEKEIIMEFITKMKQAGMIEPTESSHAASLVLVRRNGKIRICVDYRALNKCTVEVIFPQERADDILSSFHGAKYFTTLDATSGYWQMPIADESQNLTAFKCAEGTYRWRVTPFGLVNAPAQYNRWMQEVLKGLEVKRYVDDIIVSGRTLEEHNRRLGQVLQRCREHGVKLKPSKCKIAWNEVKVLGHIVSAEGIRADPEKLEAINKMAPPTKVQELRTFLGMTAFYRKFVYQFAEESDAMRRLLKKSSKWEWTPEHQKEFETIKGILASGRVVLSHPDMKRPFYIFVDASKKAIGAVLMQEAPDETREQSQEGDNGVPSNMKVVEYWSRALSKHERNYAITDLEGLGVVSAVERWHCYVYGSDLTVVTDHKPLLAMDKSQIPRQIRWRLRLAPYRFKLHWTKGSEHQAPDALSRDPRFCVAMAAVPMKDEERVKAQEEEILPTGSTCLHLKKDTLECITKMVTTDTASAPKGAEGIHPLTHLGAADSDGEALDDSEVRPTVCAISLQTEEIRDAESELLKLRIMEMTIARKKPWVKAQQEDKALQEIRRKMPNGFAIEGELLTRNGAIVVPLQFRRVVLYYAHNGLQNGHPSGSKMYGMMK